MTITVFIPNYNHAHFIGRALESLEAQTLPPDEIIVVDDGSTDDSVAVIESYGERLPQLRLVRNSSNLGANTAINRALTEATSTHVACLSADDWLQPTFIARMTALRLRFPETGVYVSQCVRYFEADGKFVAFGTDSDLGCWYAPNGPAYFRPAEFLNLLDRRFVWLSFTGAVMDRKRLQRVGGCDPALKWHADWFAIYALAVRYGFAVAPEPLSVFRIARGTFATGGMASQRQQHATCMALYRKLRAPEFRDFYDAMRHHPAALTTFMRHLLIGLFLRPPEWRFLVSLLKWWCTEVGRGKRPGFLLKLSQRLKGHDAPHFI